LNPNKLCGISPSDTLCVSGSADLKPENLLFRSPDENSDVLIADFGLSRVIDDQKLTVLTTTCGTPGYMAPEIFRKEGHSKAVDIWCVPFLGL
jgi:calcium/calmodulin-dependent protein kinase I